MPHEKDRLRPPAGAAEKSPLITWLWVVIFALAFAWVESAVVVYLREIFFDGSFSFPLVIQWEGERLVVTNITRIEFGREISTIIMLWAAGYLAGKNGLQRFCYFMIAFGLWDIFYYVWLRVMVGWPESLMTWDLLFFVPLPWVGPVITPVLIALAMTVGGSLIIYLQEKGYTIRWRWYDLVIELLCGLLMIVAFCWDWKNIVRLPGEPGRTGLPNPFAWWLYLPAYSFAAAYFSARLWRLVSGNKKSGLPSPPEIVKPG
ncbi:MAG: hypothetical protein SV487_12045 [Thermodesulfobacteriota bacterium]|nr:hypothetical protein [Thermodesulfobacteriota bacterium]